VFWSIKILNLEMIKGVHLYLVIKDLLNKLLKLKDVIYPLVYQLSKLTMKILKIRMRKQPLNDPFML